MTNDRKATASLDEVLYAFDQASGRPSAEDIIEWCERYPQCAEDIREFAAVSRDLAARERRSKNTADSSLLNRGFSQVLNLIYEAEHPSISPENAESFQQILKAKETDVPALASELNIGRSVLADLVAGRMLPPLGKRFIAALTDRLSLARRQLDAALELALNTGSPVYAKAKRAPTANARPYEGIIRSSTMPEDRKRYWLDED